MKHASLNHYYRLVWSRIQHTWVAVAEHVRSDGKSATSMRGNLTTADAVSQSMTLLPLKKKAQLSLVVLGVGLSQTAYAQWEGIENKVGQATYQYNGNTLNVNVQTNQLIANAQSLNIGVNEAVNIQQLSLTDTALFRSIGPDATSILGSVTSNGQLFLVNQNGVLFGQGAQVDVGGLVASSMSISNANFLGGNYQFNANGSANGVTNQGVIKAADGGYVVLLGSQVNNSGSIMTNGGSVVMGSAQSAQLDFYGNGLVKAKLSGDALQALVEQSGHIQADGGSVQLATSSRSSAVNVSGITQANTLVERNGVISLEGGDVAKVSVSGNVSAAGNQIGTTGGSIAVTGEQVALLDNAKLDASGNAGGGQVLVGGDYQGKNDLVDNARTTYVGQNASINVDAKQAGDGGKSIVWADQTTRYYGDISAKGGAIAGDGGFVEVSGKQYLDFHGAVDVSATNGKGGKVLLDPENIVLNNTTQVAPTDNTGTPDIAFADAPASGTTTVQINDVRGFSELHLQATNDITVDNNLSMYDNNSVHLEANNDIHINAAVSTKGTGAVQLSADNNINIDGSVTAYGTGKVTMAADADSSGAGDLNINQRIYSRTGGIELSGFNVQGATTAGYVQTQSLSGLAEGDITINAENAVNLTGNILSNGRNGAAGIDGNNGGDITVTASGAITTGNIAAYGGRAGTGNAKAGDAGVVNLNSTSAGDINTGSINARNGRGNGSGLGGATGSISIQNTSGNINTLNLNVSGDTNGAAGNVDIDAAAGNVTVTGYVYAQGATTAAGSTAAGGNGGNIDIDASSDVTVTSRIYAQGAAANAANTAVGGSGGTIDIAGKNLTFNNTVYAYGNSGRGLNQSGGDGGSINLNATGGAITAANNVYAYGGSGATGTGSNADAGNAGTVAINSTGAGDISTGHVNARNGAARGTGAGGATGSITINNSNGNINTKNLQVEGNLNGNSGAIDLDAAGDITVTGVVYAYGGVTNAGSTLSGRDGGDIDIDASGDVTVANRIYAQGAAANAANTAVGGNGGTIDISGQDLTFNNVVYAYGNAGRGLNQAGGNGGAISLNATGAITAANNMHVNGGSGATGTGSNADAGSAGAITINSIGAGDISTGNVYVQNGAARGTGAGGATGTMTINNADGDISTKNLYVHGNTNGNAGAVDLDATAGDITVTGVIYAQGGTTNAGSTAAGGSGGDIDIDASGDVTVTSRLYAQGAAANTANTAVGGSGGTIDIAGKNLTFNNTVYAYGNAGRGVGSAGGDGGSISLNATGAVTAANNIYAYGGSGATGTGSHADAGNAGTIAINSTGVGDISTGHVNARNGAARGMGAGGATGSITINNSNGNINTKNLQVEGNRNGGGGAIDVDAAAGDVTVTGVVYAQGAVTNVGSTLSGRDGGDIDIDASGDVTVTSRIYAQGAAANVANTAIGGNGGTIDISGQDLSFNNVVYAYGNAGRGIGSAGGNGGQINLNATGGITAANNIHVNGGSGATGTGSHADAGNAGTVNINSTGAGDITIGRVYVKNGAARGAGAGGAAGTMTINNADGNIATKNLYVQGNSNGNAGAIDVDAAAGDVTVTGGVYAYGGSTVAGSTAAGGNGGDVDIDASGDVTVTGRLYAQGAGVNAANIAAGGSGGTIDISGQDLTFNNAVYAQGSSGRGAGSAGGNGGQINLNAKGAVTVDNAVNATGGTGGGTNDLANTAVGGNAGLVAINSTGAGDITLNKDVYVRTGYSRGSAAGATAGSIDITNTDGNITTKNIRAEGQNHGKGSDVTIDAGLTGDVNVNGVIYTFGDRDPVATSKLGTSAGDITVKGGQVTVTNTISADGGRSKGTAGEVGGHAGDITIESLGLVSTKAIRANGGNAGTTTGAAGGDAGHVNIHSTGAGDITLTTVSARTGYTRGTATATGAGSVTIENDDGKLTATSISTRGQRRGVGGDVLAISAGDFNVTTVDARSSNLTVADDGDITIGTKITGDTTVNSVATNARWLVYSGDPRNDTVGAFKSTADFKEYNKDYGDALTDTSGDGFVYRVAPVITNTLTGSATKVYDTNTNVDSIVGLTFNQGAAIDGDVVSLSAFTSATYDNKHAGTGKTLTSNAVSVAGASNGTTQVYGYQTGAATGNVGEITQAAVTVTAVTKTKVYDGNTASIGAPIVTGILTGDTVAFTQTYDNKNVGTAKILAATGTIADGNGGNNYTVNYVTDNTGVINPKTVTVAVDTGQSKAFLTADPATFTYVSSGLLGGDALSGALVRDTGEAVGHYAINLGSLSVSSNYAINYIGAQFAITSQLNGSPRDAAAIGALAYQSSIVTLPMAVLNLSATAAGNEPGVSLEGCIPQQNIEPFDPDASLIFNFGLKLPTNIESICI